MFILKIIRFNTIRTTIHLLHLVMILPTSTTVLFMKTRFHSRLPRVRSLQRSVQEKQKRKRKPSIHFVNVFSSCPSLLKRRRRFVDILCYLVMRGLLFYVLLVFKSVHLVVIMVVIVGVKSFFPVCLLLPSWPCLINCFTSVHYYCIINIILHFLDVLLLFSCIVIFYIMMMMYCGD